MPFFECFGVGFEVADAHWNGIYLVYCWQAVEFCNALESGQWQERCFPHTAFLVKFRIANLLLAVVFAHEAVLHVEHDFLSHTVGVVEAGAVD